MVKIDVRKDDDLDRVLRRFKTRMRREGLIDELRKREFYEKPSERRRKAEEKGRRREERRRTTDQ